MHTTTTSLSAAQTAAADSATTFTDMIKNSVLNNFTATIDLPRILLSLFFAFLVGFFIYLLYKRVFSGVLYSKSFNVSLIGMTMVTALVIIAVNSNLVLSLGMVGALSIVRFRTPIKDPTDLIFLFWAAAAGIVTGAGFYVLALIGSAAIGLIMFYFIKKTSFETPYLLVVNCEDDQSEREVQKLVGQLVKRYNVKQKTVTSGCVETTLEIRLKEREGEFVNRLTALQGVSSAVLISYSGDYVS
ncbi:DUF4956 domain-containing protein [Paenibacillus sambharensis]|uniref:DUF4956 domain-containing protein n=1 Tax=Paenibacillus sambharensis TaxID=1803190 RepID=A0A2W1LFK5_9BACL|nr:DUF4956 domain-containing protein [Paenibacillus sambharensis]PZD97613.1 DUF4956 domain-containing protein [Paenibacillus sambharensis]